MSNPYKKIPTDAGGLAWTNSPAPLKALQQFGAGAGFSSVITLHDNATQVEITVMGIESSGAVIRWIPTTETAGVSPFASVIASAAGANYDHAIAVGTTRIFAIPKESQGVNSIVGLGVQNGLYRRMAIVQANAASSVYTTTY